MRSVRRRSSGPSTSAACAANAAPKRVEVLGPQLQPGGGAVPAEADQVLRAGLERRPAGRSRGCCAPSPRPPPSSSSEIDDDGPVVALDQARGDDPDHARVPALAGEDEARRLAQLLGERPQRRLRRGVDLALGCSPLAVGPAQLGCDLGGAILVVGEEQLHARVGSVEPPGSVDPRRQAERQIALIELASARSSRPSSSARIPGRCARRTSSSPRRTSERFSPTQRHDVSHGGQSDEIQVERRRRARVPRRTSRGVPPGGRMPDASRRRASQLPGDRRPAQLGERVAVERGVQDRAVGQLRARLVVVGDDDLHPELPCQAHLLHRGDPAVDGDQQRGSALRPGARRWRR